MQFQVYIRLISPCTDTAFGSGWYTALGHFGILIFSGGLLCNSTALLHPLPTEQGLIAERLPQPRSAVCAETRRHSFPQS